MLKYKCVCCNKEIECTTELPNTHDWNMMWNNGIVGKIYANYGSKHDSDNFSIAICDKCIAEKLEKNIIKKVF